MKISAAIKNAFRVYSEHFGATMKFLIVEACILLAALVPLLFLIEEELIYLALLTAPFFLLLIPWARVNAAAAMRDAFGRGSLFSYRLVEPGHYWRKLGYGLLQGLKLIIWAAPLIACVVIARNHIAGDLDGFTVMKIIKDFGGGDLMTGVLYLILIFVGTLILLVIGCAFHSGDRHAYVRNNRKLLKRHHGKLILCWFCSLIALLPLLIAIIAVIIRYIPVLNNLSAVLMNEMSLPSTKVTLMILAVGAVLTIPLLPLRSLIPAAFVNGLERRRRADS